MVQSLDRAQESAGLGETADMQFVDHRRIPRAAMPIAVLPRIVLRIDHFAGAVHVGRLVARGGVGHRKPVGQDESVARSGGGAIGGQAMPAVGLTLHRQSGFGVTQFHCDALLIRRPEAEAHAAAGLKLSAERH